MDNKMEISSNSYLTFRVGSVSFAAHVSKVVNILEIGKITKVPKSPEYMIGVINLRGTVLPVIDTRIKFGMPVTEKSINTCIIVSEVIIDDEAVQVGILVDSVQAVLDVDPETLLSPPNLGDKYQAKFIQNVITIDDEFIMVLDMDKVFSSDEVLSIKQIKETENAL